MLTLPKYIRFTIAYFLSVKDLINLSQTSKIFNISNNEYFWKFKLGSDFNLVYETKPPTLSFIQWFAQLDTTGTCLSDVGTLYGIHKGETRQVAHLVKFADLSEYNIWYTDIFDNPHYLLINETDRKDDVIKRAERIKSLGKMASIVETNMKEVFVLNTKNEIMTSWGDNFLYKFKSLIRGGHGNVYGLAINGNLFRLTNTGGSFIDKNVLSLTPFNDTCPNREVYLTSDGEASIEKLLFSDKNIIQTALIGYAEHDENVDDAIILLLNEGTVKFYKYDGFDVNNPILLQEIKNYNIRKFVIGSEPGSLYFLDNQNQLFLFGVTSKLLEAPRYNAIPFLFDTNVINIVDNFGSILVLKKYSKNDELMKKYNGCK